MSSVYSNTSSFPFYDGIFTTEPWALAVSTVLILVITALAAVVGVGGGGIVVPVLAFMLGTGVKHATPISTAAIMGTAVGKNIISLMRRHPVLVRPLIHFDLAVFSQTTMVLGTMIGVLLHEVLPEVAIVILLLTVLGYSGIDALLSGINRLKAENASIKKAKEKELAEKQASLDAPAQDLEAPAPAADSNAGDSSSNNDADTANKKVERAGGGGADADVADVEVVEVTAEPAPAAESAPNGGSEVELVELLSGEDAPSPLHQPRPTKTSSTAFLLDGVNLQTDVEEEYVQFLTKFAKDVPGTEVKGHDREAISTMRKALFEHDRRCFYWENWLVLLVLTAYVLMYTLIKNRVINIFDKCDVGWWVWTALPIVVIPILQSSFSAYMACWRELRKKAGYVYAEFELSFSTKLKALLSCIALGTGVVASLVGVGGGMVFGPVLFKLQMMPTESSATTGFMLFFTGLSGTLQYLVNESVHWEFLVWFTVTGIIGGLIGEVALKDAVTKSGRSSIIVFILCFIILVATVILVTLSVLEITALPNTTNVWAAETVCDAVVEDLPWPTNTTTVAAAAAASVSTAQA